MPQAIHEFQIPCRAAAVFALCLLAGAGSLRAAPIAQQPQSPAKYRNHLKSLQALVDDCRQHTDSAHCSTDAVGPDDIVTVPGQKAPRRISYDWLRALLEPVGNRTISSGDAAPMLIASTARLQLEESEAPGAPAMSYVAERNALTTILHRAEFRRADRSLTQRVLEAVAIWINRRLARLVEYSARRRWLALLLEW
ncbi:MAG: hypothetical protein WBQ79_11630, partial [Acidobacteriaceae bacterium]